MIESAIPQSRARGLLCGCLARESGYQDRSSLCDKDREAFFSVFLHETAYAKFHASSLLPCDGNALPPVCPSNVRDLVLEMKDASDEIKADLQNIEWLLIAGEGLMMERLLRVQTSEERNEINKSE